MERFEVECLSCGARRSLEAVDGRCLSGGVCPRCGYVGWAPSESLSERTRKLLRDLPLLQRRLEPA